MQRDKDRRENLGPSVSKQLGTVIPEENRIMDRRNDGNWNNLARKMLIEEKTRLKDFTEHDIALIPITHNKNFIILQFWGWAIKLYDDGTWVLDPDTSGG